MQKSTSTDNNSPILLISDLGKINYESAWKVQKRLFSDLIAASGGCNSPECEYLLLVEHDNVYTLGKHGKSENLLMPELLKQQNVGIFRIERGGDITFHGPGQLVAYPIIYLKSHSLGVKSYVSLLEETVIELLSEYGIVGETLDDAPGVWVGKNTLDLRKICALGVYCSRFVTMHGIALNVNTDLNAFKAINPCGFIDRGVTSIEKELGRKVDFEEAKLRFGRIFSSKLKKAGSNI